MEEQTDKIMRSLRLLHVRDLAFPSPNSHIPSHPPYQNPYLISKHLRTPRYHQRAWESNKRHLLLRVLVCIVACWRNVPVSEAFRAQQRAEQRGANVQCAWMAVRGKIVRVVVGERRPAREHVRPRQVGPRRKQEQPPGRRGHHLLVLLPVGHPARVLNEVPDEREREVPAGRVPRDHHVLRSKPDLPHEVEVPRERVEQGRRERVLRLVRRRDRQPVLHREPAPHAHARAPAVREQAVRDGRDRVLGARGEPDVAPAVQHVQHLLAGRCARAHGGFGRERAGVEGGGPVAGDAYGRDACIGCPGAYLRGQG